MSTLFKYCICPGILSLLISCNGNSPQKNKVNAKVSVATPDYANSDKHDFVLPQPISLARAFKDAGLSYEAGKTNPVANQNGYNLKVAQWLNLGVYTTDLAYCSLNNRSQEAREYLQAVQQVGTAAGLSAVFSDRELIGKFEKNLGNAAGLEDVIYDMQEKSESYLVDQDLQHLAVIQFAGSWIEGMYLGIESARTGTKVSVALADQMNLLEIIVRGLSKQPEKDKMITKLITQLQDIENVYAGFKTVQVAQKTANAASPVLTNQELAVLSQKILAVRAEIVAIS
jgi:hypothetical protein